MSSTQPFVVRGRLGRLVPHPSGHAERWLGWREALPGETPEHTLAANPEGGAKYQDPAAAASWRPVRAPWSGRGAPPAGVLPPSKRYPGRDIHLVRVWEEVPNTPAARQLVPRAIYDGDLDGPAVRAAELAAQAAATLLAAGAEATAAANAPANMAPAPRPEALAEALAGKNKTPSVEA